MSFVDNKKRKNENNDINESIENTLETNTNTNEKKKKEKKEKQNDNNTEEVIKRNRRDFAADLEEYIKAWTLKSGIIAPADDSIKWKFNKVLQSWAIDHCLHESSISSPLFYSCIPYLQSVKGAARIRMSTLAQDIIDNKDNNNNNNNNEKDNENNNEDDNNNESQPIKNIIVVDELTRNRALFLLEKLKE
jgi:hypothetical protein